MRTIYEILPVFFIWLFAAIGACVVQVPEIYFAAVFGTFIIAVLTGTRS